MIATLMSPRSEMPSRVRLCTPPKSISRMACLIGSWPHTLGAIERESLRYTSGSAAF